MTKLYRIAIAGLVLAAGLTVSCKKDYLDTVPTNSVGASTAVASFNNAIGALNGIALTMCSQQYMSSQGFCGENAIMRLYEN